MALTDLLNLPVTIVRRAVSGELDEYGSDMAIETLIATRGELQQIRRDEPVAEDETFRADWLLVLPADTPLATSDVVVVEGQEYEVVGDPAVWRNPRTQALSHLEATVRRTGGGYDEGAGS